MRRNCRGLLGLGLMLAMAPTITAQTMPKETRSGFVKTADGVKIHYLDAGKATSHGVVKVSDRPWGEATMGSVADPQILLVPGWTMPAWIWEKQIEHFSKVTRVVAMDPRSQGESTKSTEGLYPDVRARDIKAVVDQLHLAPVVLVGWSMGVNEVASYINQFGNDGVAGIVLVDGGVHFDEQFAIAILNLAGAMMKDRPARTEAFVRSMYRKPQSEEYLQHVTAAALETPTADAVALLIGGFSTDNRPALAKFARPTMLVVTKGPLDAANLDTQKRIAGARLEQFEDAGHALFVDDAERFNTLLEQFLGTLKAPGSAP
jgi:non-heme chloroperoxidase